MCKVILTFIFKSFNFKINSRGFPSSTVKNPPANAGNTGLSPGPGRSHVPQSNKAHVPRAHAPQQEKPPQ